MSAALKRPGEAPRPFRSFPTDDLIAALCREGMPIAAIARALTIPIPTIQNSVDRALALRQIRRRPLLEWDHDAEVRGLRRRIAELTDEIEELRAARPNMISGGEVFANPVAEEDVAIYGRMKDRLDLTAAEAKICLGLMRGGPRTKVAIFNDLYGLRPNEAPQPKIVDVLVCKLRRKLAAAGLDGAIKTLWGIGYAMDPEGIAEIKRRTGGDQSEEP
jgi:hypothetical protein